MQRHKKLKARILSLALSAAMVLSLMPATVFAAEGDVPLGASSITECHPAHDEDCGYLEAVESVACSHLNKDCTYSCAPIEDEDEASPSDAKKDYACDHTDDCDYVEEVEGAPCTHSCEACRVTDSGNAFMATPLAAESHGTITAAIHCGNFTKNEDCTTVNSHSGTPCWSWDQTNKTLTLSNVTSNCTSGSYCFRLPAGAIVQLAADTTNTLSTGESSSSSLYYGGSGSIGGTGKLIISSGGKGIFMASAGTSLTISGGTYNITSVASAILGIGSNAAVSITSGKITATATGGTSGNGAIGGKSITISGGEVSATGNASTIPFGKEPVTSNGIASTGAAWNNEIGATAVYEVSTSVAVSFSDLTANGTANTTDTTELTLTFDKDVTGLDAADITVTGAAKGTLTKESGAGIYKLAISNITVAEGANVNVAVAKTGFTFNPANMDVAVHKAAATGITVTISGTEYKGSTLQDAITKSGVGAAAVTSLNITAGEVTEADWKYLKNLTTMTSFEIAGTIGNDKVANIPNGIFTDAEIVPIFPQSIVTVTVPQKITIGEVAFGECSALTSVSFPTATSIGENAFQGCISLTNASFPAATTIGKSAFNGCRALTSVSFPEATSIGKYAFDNCVNLTSTNFPKMTTIDEGAFRSNVALTNASLPKVKTISARAFFGCSALATLKLPATPPTVGSANVFGDCPATRALGYVDASGTALTGDDLTNAQAAYKAFDDGDTTDNLWYGWAIVPAATNTNTGGGGSSSGQMIYTSVPPKYTGGTKIIGNVRVPDYTIEGAWKKNANGTWNFSGNGGQVYANSWAPVFNPYAEVTKGQSAFDWFKFDANGIMITGWHTDTDGNTYYLNPTSDNTLGAMQTGWVLIDGKYYYFNEMSDGTRGKLFQNTRTPDGYLVDENGVWDGNKKQ